MGSFFWGNRALREGWQRRPGEAMCEQRTERGGCEARADPGARCDAAQRETATADSPTPRDGVVCGRGGTPKK